MPILQYANITASRYIPERKMIFDVPSLVLCLDLSVACSLLKFLKRSLVLLDASLHESKFWLIEKRNAWKVLLFYTIKEHPASA